MQKQADRRAKNRARAWGDALRIGLGVGGLGLATGTGVGLMNLIRDERRRREREDRALKDFVGSRPDVVDVPVSREEAERLRQRGVGVKTAATNAVRRWGGAGLLSALMGYTGWRAGRGMTYGARASAQKQRNEDLRRRIQHLLEDDPDERDLKLAAYMDAAVDTCLPLPAKTQEKRASAVRSLGNFLLFSLGAGAGVSAIGAVRGATANPYARRAQDLRAHRPATFGGRQGVTLRPVLREDEEDRRPGSPAEQARGG